jgi:hypothetical protein
MVEEATRNNPAQTKGHIINWGLHLRGGEEIQWQASTCEKRNEQERLK